MILFTEFYKKTMVHEGKAIKAKIKELGQTQVWLAERMNVTDNTVSYHLQKPYLKSEFIIKIGKALRYDLSDVIPRLKALPEVKELNFFNENPSEVMHEVSEMKRIHEEQLQVTADQKAQIHHLEVRIKDLESSLQDKSDLIQAKDVIIESLQKRLSKYERG